MGRCDGRVVKSVAPIQKIIPYIMKTRGDSMNMYEDSFSCQPLDAYIREKRAEGTKVTYMHIFIAAVVRMMALRPQLNRFVMRGKIYTRPKIWVSFVVHPRLCDGDVETTIKLAFEGTEGLLEIVEKVNEAIRRETHARAGENGTDKLARLLTCVPGPVISAAVNTLMWMDRHNLLPKAIIDLSPFHTSFFLTNLKSLGINHIFHHIYEFGTTSIFFAMGKEKFQPVIKRTELGTNVELEKRLCFGLVSDERICDGLYYALSLRQMRKLMRDPWAMEKPLEKKVQDIR